MMRALGAVRFRNSDTGDHEPRISDLLQWLARGSADPLHAGRFIRPVRFRPRTAC